MDSKASIAKRETEYPLPERGTQINVKKAAPASRAANKKNHRHLDILWFTVKIGNPRVLVRPYMKNY